MRASDLDGMEQRVAQMLQEETDKDTERRRLLLQVHDSICQRKELLARLEKEKQEKEEVLAKKKEALSTAKLAVSEREKAAKQRKKEELLGEYRKTISNVNELNLVLSAGMPRVVTEIMEMQKHALNSNFTNLAAAVSSHVVERIEEAIVSLICQCTTLRTDKAIALVKSINQSLRIHSRAYADTNSRQLFYVRACFRHLLADFSHHFFSEFETNRLDKPEWYLDYLLKELQGLSPLFAILEQVDALDLDTDEEKEGEGEKEAWEEGVSVYYKQTLDRVVEKIVGAKLRECVQGGSRQKKKLILHHCAEISRFFAQVKTHFRYVAELVLDENSANKAREVFSISSDDSLRRLLGRKYTEWPEGFRAILRTAFAESASLIPFVEDMPDVLVDGALRNYIHALSAFSEGFTYDQEKEHRILMYLLSEALKLEEDVLELENDLGVALEKVVVLNTDMVSAFKEKLMHVLDVVLEEGAVQALSPLRAFRFLDVQEIEQAVLDYSDWVDMILELPETEDLVDLLKKKITFITDKHVSGEIVTDKIDGEADIRATQHVLHRISEALRDNGVSHTLKRAQKKLENISPECAPDGIPSDQNGSADDDASDENYPSGDNDISDENYLSGDDASDEYMSDDMSDDSTGSSGRPPFPGESDGENHDAVNYDFHGSQSE